MALIRLEISQDLDADLMGAQKAPAKYCVLVEGFVQVPSKEAFRQLLANCYDAPDLQNLITCGQRTVEIRCTENAEPRAGTGFPLFFSHVCNQGNT